MLIFSDCPVCGFFTLNVPNTGFTVASLKVIVTFKETTCTNILFLRFSSSEQPVVPACGKTPHDVVFLKKQALKLEGNGALKCPSPALCATVLSPTTTPRSTPAKHIWTTNNSFRFLRLALLLRRFSIIPPPTTVSGIPSTTTRAMALFSQRAFRRYPRWWCKGTRT